MKKQVSSISIKQSSKFMAVMYFIMTAIFLIPLGIFTMIQGEVQAGGILLVLPFVYGIVGFIFFALFAFIYNVIAEMVGGIEVSIKDIE